MAGHDKEIAEKKRIIVTERCQAYVTKDLKMSGLIHRQEQAKSMLRLTRHGNYKMGSRQFRLRQNHAKAESPSL